MGKTALIVLFNGCEDVEAATTIDVLRRGKVDVTIASLESSVTVATASRMVWAADRLLSDIDSDEQFDAVIIPGGQGTFLLLDQMKKPESEWPVSLTLLRDIFTAHAKRRDVVAAICAAPLVLGLFGLLEGATCCCYPSCESQLSEMEKAPAKIRNDVDAVTYGNIITSRGPATAQVFAHSILTALAGAQTANNVSGDMLARIRSQE